MTTTTSAITDYSSYVTAASKTSSTDTSSTGTSTATDTAKTAYNTFLTLLTTQLQHQDPLNPTDTDKFTSEMIQLSSVEQELKTNQTLATISTDLSSISAANGLGYIGKTVTATGSTVPIQDGTADWNYSLASTAKTTTLSVLNSSGTTVYTTTGNATSGTHSFSWDGTTTSGTKATSGDYTLKVTATDSAGATVTTTTAIVGTVTGVDTSGGTTELKIGDVDVALSDVTNLTN